MFKASLFTASVLMVFSSASWAQDLSCSNAASDKKLAGAAKSSFLKKCEKDAVARCDLGAQEKKLSGAAKNSFTKKCIKDAVGS